MLDLVAATDTQSESEHYASLSLLQKYPKPTPVYYRNYHVGECKGKLKLRTLQRD